MNKTVLFVLLDDFADWEAAFLASALRGGVMPGHAGSHETAYATPGGRPVRSIGGMTVAPDRSLEEGLPADCAGVVLIGGMSWRRPEADEVLPLVREALSRGILGSALDVAPTLGGEFDLVFIDGDKREYPAYYRMLLGDDGQRPLVHAGSVIIADNILWSGKVAQAIDRHDRHTQALVEFNRMIVEDPRVENVIVPLRDGLNLIRVK